MTAEPLGQRAADSVERIGIHIVAHADHGIPHDTAIGNDHQQRALAAHRYQLQRTDAKLRTLGAHHQRCVMRQPRQRLRRTADYILHLLRTVGKVGTHIRGITGADGPVLKQLVHIQPIRLGAGNAPRAHMRLVQITQFLQIAHLVADGSRAQTHLIFFGDGAAAHRNGGQDIVIDDRLQNAKLTCVHRHPFHLPDGMFHASGLLALVKVEC